MTKSRNKRNNYFILAAVFSLLVLVFISADIAVPIVRKAVIIMSGLSALIFEYLLFAQADTKISRNQGIVLLALTFFTIIFRFIA